jgi:predicted RNA-binding Zn-ribbon protein involved in translation (DUF1610 family)
MDTLNNISNVMNVKIYTIKKVLSLLMNFNRKNKAMVDRRSAEYIKYLEKDITSIGNDHKSGSIIIFSEYNKFIEENEESIKNIHDAKTKNKMKRKNDFLVVYNFFINSENFIGRMDRLMDNIGNYISSESTPKQLQYADKSTSLSSELRTLIQDYYSLTLDKFIEEHHFRKCSNCNKEMEVLSETDEIECRNCGEISKICGTITDINQMATRNRKAKRCSYRAPKHCNTWIQRILAIETPNIPDKVIVTIKRKLKRDGIKTKRKVTCPLIRKYLKECNYTDYNKHIPTIKKIITGEAPEPLTEDELQLMYIYFELVVSIFEKVKPANKTNCPHPYFIFKILEQVLKNNEKKKNNILSHIYLQSRETLIENDILWKKICSYINDFEYISTNVSYNK